MPNFTTEQIRNAMSNPDNIRNLSIVAQVDAGKYFKVGTKIRLFDGTLKQVEYLTTEDYVTGIDGNSKRIIEIHEGNDQLYKVSQNNGDDYIVNGNHILVLKTNDDKNRDLTEISVLDYLNLPDDKKESLCGFKLKIADADKIEYHYSAISVTEHEVNDYVGFQIEGDGKFLAPDFTVWHNSTLSDSILCHAGLINKNDAGEKRQTDTMQQEQDRGITIKAVGVSMCLPHENKDYVINFGGHSWSY